MRFRRRREQGDQPDRPDRGGRDGGPALPPPDAVQARRDRDLAATVARHFTGATVDGSVARLGEFDLEIDCRVVGIREIGGYASAELHFSIVGRDLASGPVAAAVNGYHADPEMAIAEGGCLWTCTLASALRSALHDEFVADAEAFEIDLDGRRYRAATASIDRVVTVGDAPREDLVDTRRRIAGERWLTPTVLRSGRLPWLAGGNHLLGVFVGEFADGRTTEVKVDGGDWPAASGVFDAVPPSTSTHIPMLRELTVLRPLGPPTPLTRPALERTLAGFSRLSDSPWQPAGWLGWRTHGGALGPTLTAEQVGALEAFAGPLEAGHRRFLLEVAASGAGPGYGLLSPVPIGDRIVLAEAGCGVVWFLRLDGEHRGTVWVDASASDERVEQVAGSFVEWYLAWLEATVRRDRLWVQWDNRACAPTKLLVDARRAGLQPDAPSRTTLAGVLRANAITLAVERDGVEVPIDPCQACTVVAHRLGVGDEVFAPGVLRQPAR